MPNWWTDGQRYMSPDGTPPDETVTLVRIGRTFYIKHGTRRSRFYELSVLRDESGGATGRFLLEDYVNGDRYLVVCTAIGCSVQKNGGRVINYRVTSPPGDIGTPLTRIQLDQRQIAVSVFQVAGSAMFVCFSRQAYQPAEAGIISRGFLIETGNDKRQRITEFARLTDVSAPRQPQVSLQYDGGTFLVPRPGEAGGGNWSGRPLRQLSLTNYNFTFGQDGHLSRMDVRG